MRMVSQYGNLNLLEKTITKTKRSRMKVLRICHLTCRKILINVGTMSTRLLTRHIQKQKRRKRNHAECVVAETKVSKKV
jgi:hypothetical protein